MPVERSPPSSKGDAIPLETSSSTKRTANELLNDSLSPSEQQITKKPNIDTLIEMGPKKTRSPSKETKDKDNIDSTIQGTVFNIPVNNRFSELNNLTNNSKNHIHDNVNNADASRNKIEKIQIPPITVVGATNFSSAIKIVSEIAKEDFFIKYMSIGVKIHVVKLEQYNAIKAKLVSSNIEFYSHDVNPEKFDHFIVSGLNKVSTTDLNEELKSKGFEAVNVTEIPIKKPRFLNEGLYRVSFKAGSVKLTELTRVRLNHTVVRWSKSLNSKKRITQCRKCMEVGTAL